VAGVVGVAEVFAAAAEAEGLLVALHGFIVGIWGGKERLVSFGIVAAEEK